MGISEDPSGKSINELKELMEKTSLAIARNKQSLESTRAQIEKTRIALQEKDNSELIKGLVAENKKLIEQNRQEIAEMNDLLNTYQQAFEQLRSKQVGLQQQHLRLLPLPDEPSSFLRKTTSIFEDIDYLLGLLKHYESMEDYENCAVIRDRIKNIQKAA